MDEGEVGERERDLNIQSFGSLGVGVLWASPPACRYCEKQVLPSFRGEPRGCQIGLTTTGRDGERQMCV